jgi:hypothetical protein
VIFGGGENRGVRTEQRIHFGLARDHQPVQIANKQSIACPITFAAEAVTSHKYG